MTTLEARPLFPHLRLLEPSEFRRLIVVGLSLDRPLCSDEPLPLDRALAHGHLRLGEASTGATVPEIEATNRHSQPVLVLAGEEVVGARQNRILDTSAWIAGHQQMRLPVSCVEQGRWTQTTAAFQGGGTIYFPSAMRRHAEEVTQSYRTQGKAQANQCRVWQDVTQRMTMHGVASVTSRVHDVFSTRTMDVAEYEHTLQPSPDQAGFIVLRDGRLMGLHLFPSTSFCHAVWTKHLRSYALDAESRPSRRRPTSRGRVSMVRLQGLLDEIAGSRFEVFPGPGGASDLRFAGQDYTGHGLAVSQRLVHLCAFA